MNHYGFELTDDLIERYGLKAIDWHIAGLAADIRELDMQYAEFAAMTDQCPLMLFAAEMARERIVAELKRQQARRRRLRARIGAA